MRVCILLYTTFVHNTAQNSSDNLPSYPPDNHHCSDAVTTVRITDMTVYDNSVQVYCTCTRNCTMIKK